jgi:hypothetical protein
METIVGNAMCMLDEQSEMKGMEKIRTVIVWL